MHLTPMLEVNRSLVSDLEGFRVEKLDIFKFSFEEACEDISWKDFLCSRSVYSISQLHSYP